MGMEVKFAFVNNGMPFMGSPEEAQKKLSESTDDSVKAVFIQTIQSRHIPFFQPRCLRESKTVQLNDCSKEEMTALVKCATYRIDGVPLDHSRSVCLKALGVSPELFQNTSKTESRETQTEPENVSSENLLPESITNAAPNTLNA